MDKIEQATLVLRKLFAIHNAPKSIEEIVARGGPGSGNFGHEGRPGEVGGSSTGEGPTSPSGNLADKMRQNTERHMTALKEVGIKPGDRFVAPGLENQTWEFTRTNDLGVPYFVKVKDGKAQKTEFTNNQLEGQFRDRLKGS